MKNQIRVYSVSNSIVFFKTREKYGEFSNMTPGFVIPVEDYLFKSSEALFQTCKFPYSPEIQFEIYDQVNGFSAKKVAQAHKDLIRKDWFEVNIKVMKWVLEMKAYSSSYFRELLVSTGDVSIVEKSFKDSFWGAQPQGGNLVGVNALGRLLMGVRRDLNSGKFSVQLPRINDFYLFGSLLENISFKGGLTPPKEFMK